MHKYFLTFLLLSVSATFFGQTGVVKGRVFNHKNNEPVPFVNIIIDGKPTQGTTSDIDGNYSITKVSPGFTRLVASSVGFKKFISDDFLVTNSKTTDIDIGLDEQIITLEQVTIKPSVVERNEEVPVSLQKLTIQEIERSPGSNRDISKVIQSLPGVASSPSFRNDVIVRGGGPGENRFNLDGVEIPYLNHFSTLTLNGLVTKNSSLIFSVRRSYLQLLFSALKLPFLPTYNDYQFKYKIDLDKRNQISVISIGALDNNKLNTGIANPDAFQRYILQSLPVNDQWSYVFGLVYRHFRARGYDTWVVSRNMLNNDQIKYTNNVEMPDSLLFRYNSQETENKLRYEGLTDLVKWKITYGAGLEDAKYANKMNNLLDQFSPRLSASYAFVPDKFFLNFNMGRYYQLPAYTSLGFRSNNGALVNDSLGIKYISADHVVLGLEYQPDTKTKISLEGFGKFYANYPFSIRDSVALASKGTDFGAVGDEPLLPLSNGRAYGFEVLVRNADFFKFNVILTYTFVRSEFTTFTGDYIPSAWDNRHLINVTVGRKFKGNWEIGAKWRFAGGQPYTPWDMDKSGLVTAWNAQGRGYLD
ncbi:MAG: TonB-dependent receptor [Bacteroidales bacterium]|nr:TonB-dependent receptor [Bacteroidales bacterium]